VARPGLDAGGTTGGWTIPLTGSSRGSFLGGGVAPLGALEPPDASGVDCFEESIVLRICQKIAYDVCYTSWL